MSVLDRYKKNGGFVQLLTLIETSNTAKKEKFLQLILEESPEWHKAIKERILTLDIILQWPLEYLSELTSRSLPMTLAAISKSPISEEFKKKLMHGLPHTHLSKIRDIIENKTFTANEITSSIDKFLSEVRAHIHQGVIKLEKFAPDYVIPDGIEEQLMKKNSTSPSFILDDTISDSPSDTPQSPHATSHTPPLKSQNTTTHTISSIATHLSSNNSPSMTQNGTTLPSPKIQSQAPIEELNTLKRLNQQLQQELQILRQENKMMRDKLDKIRKIA